jgi:flagellar export protein FliJ
MSKFMFRLAGLLKLREAARDEKRLRLAEAAETAASIRRKLQAVDDELAARRCLHRQTAGPGPIDLARLRDARRFEELLQSQEDSLGVELRQAEEAQERWRLDTVEAHREVRVLENLRARQAERHHQQTLRLEIAQVDEAAARGGQARFSGAPCEAWSADK